MTDTDQAATADDELVERLKFGAFCFGAEVCDTNPQRCPCSQRKKAAAAITRLRAELAELQGYVSMQQSGHLREEFDLLKGELAAAVQRAEAAERECSSWQEKAADYYACWKADRLTDRQALAAERAARERIEKELRRKAHDAILTTSKVAYTDAAAIVALAAPAEASAGEADRTFTDEMVEAGARELVRIEHAKHPWAHYMICSRAVLGAALNIPTRPAQKDSEG
jgi:hypothetical protein